MKGRAKGDVEGAPALTNLKPFFCWAPPPLLNVRIRELLSEASLRLDVGAQVETESKT